MIDHGIKHKPGGLGMPYSSFNGRFVGYQVGCSHYLLAEESVAFHSWMG